MTATYYHLLYQLNGTIGYLIWFSNDKDSVVLQPDGLGTCFSSLLHAHTYATAHQLGVQEETPVLHDLDLIARWLQCILSADVDCKAFLNAWNLFDNVAVSVGATFRPDDTETYTVYEKLFWGSNLPVLTPPGEHYIPVWSDDELLLLRATLANGLALFRSVVTLID